MVSPIEIEMNTLLEHACVKEAAGVGEIKAVITLLPGNDVTHAELVVELQEWCKGKLERYQYPHLIDFVRVAKNCNGGNTAVPIAQGITSILPWRNIFISPGRMACADFAECVHRCVQQAIESIRP